MDKDEYEKAWREDEEGDGPIENAVEAAAKKAKAEEQDEYIRAYSELKDEEVKGDDK